ncbi:MAG: TMEM175 family protein [Pyrinomonadaceae bacterium]
MSNKVYFQIERIAFFSDAVFAIAITLLIIEIHPPVFTVETTADETYQAFLHLLPELVAVLVSFALISLNWRRHHQLFGFMDDYDEKLITLNFFSLVAIIFLPFSTAFISKNYARFWPDPLSLPFVVYCINNLACAFFNFLLFRYALDPENRLFDPAAAPNYKRIKLEVLYPVFVFAAAAIVGYYSPFVALACFALFALEPLFIKLVLQKNGEKT